MRDFPGLVVQIIIASGLSVCPGSGPIQQCTPKYSFGHGIEFPSGGRSQFFLDKIRLSFDFLLRSMGLGLYPTSLPSAAVSIHVRCQTAMGRSEKKSFWSSVKGKFQPNRTRNHQQNAPNSFETSFGAVKFILSSSPSASSTIVKQEPSIEESSTPRSVEVLPVASGVTERTQVFNLQV